MLPLRPILIFPRLHNLDKTSGNAKPEIEINRPGMNADSDPFLAALCSVHNLSREREMCHFAK